MTLRKLLQTLSDDGMIEGPGDVDDLCMVLDTTYNVDPETPIPVWNPEAQAWEV